MAAYLTPAGLLRYYDARRVLQFATDDPDVEPVAEDLEDATTEAYKIVDSCLVSASSDIDSHCQQGKRYTRDVLETIIEEAAAAEAETDDNPELRAGKIKRAGKLRQLTADLGYGLLLSRRGMNSARLESLAPRYATAEAQLEKLALGITVFDVDANIEAGVPQIVTIGKNRYKPSEGNRMFGIWNPNDFSGGW